jgi:hypothetical protein
MLLNLFALLTMLNVCVAQPDDRLIGLWEGVPNRGGLGSTVELRRDGTAVTATTVMVDHRYRVEDGRLITLDEAGNMAEFPFRFENGRLIFPGPRKR